MFDGEVDVLLSTAFSTCFKYLYLRLFLMGNLLSYSTRIYWLQYGGGGWACPKTQHGFGAEEFETHPLQPTMEEMMRIAESAAICCTSAFSVGEAPGADGFLTHPLEPIKDPVMQSGAYRRSGRVGYSSALPPDFRHG